MKINIHNLQSSVHAPQKKLKIYLGDTRNHPASLLKEFDKFITPEEKERSNRFLKPADKKTYKIAHYYLNTELIKIQKNSFSELKFVKSKYGKPLLKSMLIDYNLSHTDSLFAFAISNQTNQKVGIDIEKKRDITSLQNIVKSNFHPIESDYILSPGISNEIKTQRFFDIWTRKEALLKLLGIGISDNLAEYNLLSTNSCPDLEHVYEENCDMQNIHIYTIVNKLSVLSIASNQNFHPELITIL
jgi:phosphopantetheinyl transferase